jgi:hypothetical protein
MIRFALFGLFLFCWMVCGLPLAGVADPITLTAKQQAAVEKISPRRMKEVIDFLAADEQGGRIPGSEGHRRSREMICKMLKSSGIVPMGHDGSYYHTYKETPIKNRYQRNADGKIVPNDNRKGYNIVGLLKGSDPKLAGDYIVYVAHYDHLGVNSEGKVFNGAFDNASGVAVGLEVAQVLAENDAAPKRSILFLFSDNEESGLKGAQAWLKDPTVPLDKIVMAISADPLGRPIMPDYPAISVMGLERSPELLKFWRQTTKFASADIGFVHRSVIPLFSSDQDRFHKFGIPAMWFVNPGMGFYHQTNDNADTIDYRLLLDDARYIASSMLLVGNTDQRFKYVGKPEMDTQTGQDARVILAGVLGSKQLTADERKIGQRLLTKLDKMIVESKGKKMTVSKLYYFQVVTFFFAISRNHPGEIPPPFPEVGVGGK